MGLFKIVTKPIGCLLTLVGALVVGIVLLAVGFIWAVDELSPEIAERAITEATGFPTTVEDGSVSFKNQTLTLTNIEIDSPNDFPDREFLHIAEFTVGLDRQNWNAEKMALSEVTLIIDELSFVQGNTAVSNLEAFIESAEENWAKAILQIQEQAAEKDQTVPGKLVIAELNLELRRVKLANVSGPETIYRVLDVNYAKTFQNVEEIRPIIESIAADLQANGLENIAQTLQQKDQEMDEQTVIKMLEEQMRNNLANPQ
ncbi:hypothetical protein [Cerasicoccus arenae]|uniref:Uncharacterized protein n=1 Tax=Cerasicoccus arenae TaxID=424488 RepID=A0A8J3DIF2_9BACT|nr:hypothetical protein [Cerasicoccus arenae]MBK1858808.1 hypothetical protein [Cerasicoccus arenae]GHC04475.1 hypothetical protein GCM10007047_21550 [Cerasicoccus arenae]